MSRKRNKITPSKMEEAATRVPLPVLSHAGPCRNPECVMCPEWRVKLGRQNQTEIYAVKGDVRYCKCRVCSFTWKVVLSRSENT